MYVVTPEGSGVMVNGLLVTTAVFKEVGIVVVDFGIVRQSLDTRAETRRKKVLKRRRHGVIPLKEMGGKSSCPCKGDRVILTLQHWFLCSSNGLYLLF